MIHHNLIHGAVDIEQTADGLLPYRLPAWARAQCPDPQLAMAAAQPSGVRLVFQTTATSIELDTLPTKRAYAGMAARPDGVYDLYIDGKLFRQVSAATGKTMHINMATGASTITPGTPQTLHFSDLPTGDKTIEIWLPHDETTELVDLRANAAITPTTSGKRRWLHHGSSISQGSNAASPSGIWPAVAARQAGIDLMNLGFGGNALLDPFTARTMRDLPADLISVKMGINLVNTDLLRLRAFVPAVHGFLDTIRDGHPTTPLLLISPVYCPIHEDTPGPCLFDLPALSEGRLLFRAAGSRSDIRQGKLTLRIIREQLQAIVKQRQANDPKLHYLDGTELYGAADNARLPLPDELHPDAATHQLIGERFNQLAFASGAFVRNAC
ncbi:lipase [Pseudoduganella sp. FT25W]|uniref:Lipase n=1 Tax=Duganella alba TaxID=2666081 RepID=A0A6L5QGZ9_9BURK|nr:SGNH/GDSL hydrolase family protein [Duganella alba]MRX08979.1 lipase [Duganella alba]MRX18975.1 lipase [Duganella alba]